MLLELAGTAAGVATVTVFDAASDGAAAAVVAAGEVGTAAGAAAAAVVGAAAEEAAGEGDKGGVGGGRGEPVDEAAALRVIKAGRSEAGADEGGCDGHL